VAASTLTPKYGEAVDRDSARERLAARLEAGAAAAEQEKANAAAKKPAPKPAGDRIDYPTGTTRAPSRKKQDAGMVQDLMKSPMARDLMRTAAREIVRGVFGVGRRR
jgi:hypothetical protein